MASPIGTLGAFDITSDDRGSSITIHISEQAGITSENLSLSTWGASFVLANQLHKIATPSHVSKPCGRDDFSVLELGAGTGLVGLTAAALWRANALLTDLEPILPGVDANISLNRSLLAKQGSTASCGSLDWTDPSFIRLSSIEIRTPNPYMKPSVILAADTIYSEDHPELLVNTITTWLADGPDARVIFCYPLRMAYIDHIREFWQLMEDAGLHCIDEGREEGEEKWNEVANTPYEWCVWAWKAD